MSAIPSSAGPSGGLTRVLNKFSPSSAIGVTGVTGPGGPTLLSATNVSEYDEVVLNIRCFDNFSPATSGYTFAQEVNIEILYSTVNEYRAPPPIGAAINAEYWSKLLAESLITPFTGATEVASYKLKIDALDTGSSIIGVTKPINISVRIPVVMAQWIVPILSVDTLGLGSSPANLTWPTIAATLYRGVTL